VVIFAASTDTAETNAKFAKEGSYPWVILSDPDKKLANALGVVGPMGFAHRWTYFVDEQGHIAKVDKDVKPTDYGKTLARQLAELHVPEAAKPH
jgi:peroxiredoxin Q/BCP